MMSDPIAQLAEEADQYRPCMMLTVDRDGLAVELMLDTAANTYVEPIPGVGADCGLRIDMDTQRVVGIRLPLIRNNLCVNHRGPIRINDGFRKGDEA